MSLNQLLLLISQNIHADFKRPNINPSYSSKLAVCKAQHGINFLLIWKLQAAYNILQSIDKSFNLYNSDNLYLQSFHVWTW